MNQRVCTHDKVIGTIVKFLNIKEQLAICIRINKGFNKNIKIHKEYHFAITRGVTEIDRIERIKSHTVVIKEVLGTCTGKTRLLSFLNDMTKALGTPSFELGVSSRYSVDILDSILIDNDMLMEELYTLEALIKPTNPKNTLRGRMSYADLVRFVRRKSDYSILPDDSRFLAWLFVFILFVLLLISMSLGLFISLV
jgi:hypothetical protein